MMNVLAAGALAATTLLGGSAATTAPEPQPAQPIVTITSTTRLMPLPTPIVLPPFGNLNPDSIIVWPEDKK